MAYFSVFWCCYSVVLWFRIKFTQEKARCPLKVEGYFFPLEGNYIWMLYFQHHHAWYCIIFISEKQYFEQRQQIGATSRWNVSPSVDRWDLNNAVNVSLFKFSSNFHQLSCITNSYVTKTIKYPLSNFKAFIVSCINRSLDMLFWI